MTLSIDTSDNKKVTVGLDGESWDFLVTKPGSQSLLNLIDEILKKEGKTTKDLNSLKVNSGPGSYTGLKVGTAVANALAWSLKIPVNGREQVFPTYEEEEKR